MHEMSELISVIVPIYKVEKYLDQCIKSIVDQTYRNLEIILVDDGSPDQCPDICDGWAEKDHRIIVLHMENGGVSSARNAGIDKAKGRYIVFLDGDDWVESLYIEYLYCAICDTGSDISECSYTRDTDFLNMTTDGRLMSEPCLQTAEEALRIWSHPKHEELNLVVWNKMYSSEILGEIRFAEGFDGGEDVLFTCLVFGKCRKIAHIDNELYHWRNTPGSASKRFPDNSLQSVEMLFSALDYLERDYPSVATDCKVHMCHIMNEFFYHIKYEAVIEHKQEAKEKMLSFRRRLYFTAKEWKQCTLKDKIVIICSNSLLVGIYIRFRHFLAVIKRL